MSSRNPRAEAQAALHEARQAMRSFEDALLVEADRAERLGKLNARGAAVEQQDLARRFPAMAERSGR